MMKQILLIVAAISYACEWPERKTDSYAAQDINQEKVPTLSGMPALLFDTTLATGFDYPVGGKNGKEPYISLTDHKLYNSWRVDTKFAEVYSLGIHPGLDINGTGGGNTDLGQPVYSIARGVVVAAEDYGAPWGGVVMIAHRYLENGSIQTCYSLYAHMENLRVRKNMFIRQGVKVGEIGTGKGSYPAHLHLEIRKANMASLSPVYWPSANGNDITWVKKHYTDPYEFIENRRVLPNLRAEENVLIAVKSDYTLYHYKKGKCAQRYQIALSQNPIGHKQLQGDLKMPEGDYYICEKLVGPFEGYYAAYLGNYLLRISYPNSTDAEKGYEKGRISAAEKKAIFTAIRQRKIPPRNTALGGGIVIHGWSGDWVADGNQNLTWGCISMHNRDLSSFYKQIPLGTRIIIVP